MRAAALLLAVAVACGPAGPRPVVLGEDQCAQCRMTISDERFGAQVVTRTGRVHVFDAIECMAGWVRGHEAGAARALYVADLEHPGTFVPAEGAGYLRDTRLRGPMGTLVAFATPEAARAAQATLGGTVVAWTEVLAAGDVHGASVPGGH